MRSASGITGARSSDGTATSSPPLIACSSASRPTSASALLSQKSPYSEPSVPASKGVTPSQSEKRPHMRAGWMIWLAGFSTMAAKSAMFCSSAPLKPVVLLMQGSRNFLVQVKEAFALVATRMWCLLPTMRATFPCSMVVHSHGMFCSAKNGVSSPSTDFASRCEQPCAKMVPT